MTAKNIYPDHPCDLPGCGVFFTPKSRRSRFCCDDHMYENKLIRKRERYRREHPKKERETRKRKHHSRADIVVFRNSRSKENKDYTCPRCRVTHHTPRFHNADKWQYCPKCVHTFDNENGSGWPMGQEEYAVVRI